MSANVGSITVTVNADTKTFEPQVVAAGKRAGNLAGKAYGREFCKEASQRIRRCLDKTMKGRDRDFGRAGERSGSSFGGGFGKGLTKRMRLILGALIAFAEPLAAVLQGAAGAGTALAGSLYKAVAAGGALIPIAAGLAATLGAVVIGSQGMGTAFKAISKEWKDAAASGRKFNMQSKEIQKALKNLTPEARKTAYAFGRMQKPLEDMRKSVQEALFKGMAKVLDDISKRILPELSVGFTALAKEANRFAKDFVGMLDGFDLGKIMGDLAPTMRNVLAAFTSFASGFMSFIQAATPAAELLSIRFKNMADSFKAMVERGKESGAINDFLTDAQIHMAAWWSLIKSTGSALNTILKAGESFGLGMVQSLDGIMVKWNEWMNTVEGQAALQQFFTMARDSMSALVPILVGLRDAFSILVTPDAIARLADLSTSIGAILPVLAQLLSVVAQTGLLNTFAGLLAGVGQAIQPLIPILEQMAGVISDALAMALPIVVNGFMEIGKAIEPLLAALVPLFAELLPALVAAFSPFIDIIVLVVKAIADGLTPIIKSLTPIIAELAPVIALVVVSINPFVRAFMLLGPIVAPLIPLLGQLIAWLLDLIAPFAGIIAKVAEFVIGFKMFGKVFGDLGKIFGGLGKVFGGAKAAIVSFASQVRGAFTGTIQILGNVGKVIFNIATFWPRMMFRAVQGIINVFKTLWPAIRGGLDELWAGIQRFALELSMPFRTAVSSIAGAFNGIRTAIVGQLQMTWQAFTMFFKNIASGISGIATSISVGMRMAFQSVVGVIRNVAAGVGTVVREIIGYFLSLPNKIKTAIQGIATAFSDVMRSAYDRVVGWVNKIKGAFSNMWNGIKGRLPFFAAGGITKGPSVVGEAGPEMVIPLTRPLSQIDPSVRQLAAMLRGQSTDRMTVSHDGKSGPLKVVNNDIKVYAASTDPSAVAEQVVNRSVAMAQ
jgi:phage-related protein